MTPIQTPSMNRGMTIQEEVEQYKGLINKIKKWKNFDPSISEPIISMAITNMLYFDYV